MHLVSLSLLILLHFVLLWHLILWVQLWRAQTGVTQQLHWPSNPPFCPEHWAPDCHSHAHSLFIVSLPPRFQYVLLHFSFLRRFHLPSLYISLTHFPGLFAGFYSSSSPHPFLHCPSPSKAIIPLPFCLYLHDTEVFLEAGAHGKKEDFFYKNALGLISSPHFSSQPKSFIAELTVPL